MKFSNAKSAVIDMGDDTIIKPYKIEGVNIEFDDPTQNNIKEATITIKCVADEAGNVLMMGSEAPATA